MIKVLVVDDSSVMREYLSSILEENPDIRVVGTAKDGREAVDMVERLNPDVITMDVHMPVMDGFTATRVIMETFPTPILIVTASYDPSEVEKSFHALEAGALTILEKPVGPGHPGHVKAVAELLTMIKLMSEVKVIKRRSPRNTNVISTPSVRNDAGEPPGVFKIIAIGASAGGPVTLQRILSKLPPNLFTPILIVQHISEGFLQGLVDWLGEDVSLPIHVATHGETPLPGHIYFAPDKVQMGVDHHGCITLTRNHSDHGICPSVAYLFNSIAGIYGQTAIGVLLTGMGRDGAEELKVMRENGGVTIAQDEKSSIVYGMPGEAKKIDAATHILNPEEIAAVLTQYVKTNNSGWKDT